MAATNKRKGKTLRLPKRYGTTLTEQGILSPRNFLTATTATHTKLYGLQKDGDIAQVEEEPFAVSAILKLTLHLDTTNPMTVDWSRILWDITQKNLLPEGVYLTTTRIFERRDNKLAEKAITGRRWLATLSSNHGKNKGRQNVFLRHDAGLLAAMGAGDGTLGFGAEAILSAPDEVALEEAMDILQNYLKANEESRGLTYELDINRQMHPFLLYGPNRASKNQDVTVEVTASDAAICAQFVDAGGDRTPGSEYLGVSVGKLIQSHAAYPLRHDSTLFVGNASVGKTGTLLRDGLDPKYRNLPSQIYLSLAASRAYLLEGHSVTHIVLDRAESAKDLLTLPLNKERVCSVDVSQGLLNLLELLGEPVTGPRVVGRFTTHLDNLILLLSEYREGKASMNDAFADITRSILTDFYIANKYYHYNPLEHLEDIRLFGRHDQFRVLADLGAWIAERRKSNTDAYLTDALAQLDTILNSRILPTIPALNTQTDPVIDRLVRSPYRVLDFTGLSGQSLSLTGDATTHVLLLAYLNMLLPSLANGDVLVFHGLSKVLPIVPLIEQMLENSGLQLHTCCTEETPGKALSVYEAKEGDFGLLFVDLYRQKVDKLMEPFGMDAGYTRELERLQGSYFLRTRYGADYIFLDHIL